MAYNFIGFSFRIELMSVVWLDYVEFIGFAWTLLLFYLVGYFFGLIVSLMSGLSIKPIGFYRFC